MNFLFVSGMFRSGTTLLGRMLNANPSISVASDPYLPYFKFFRSYAAKNIGINVKPEEPLDEYYFSSLKLRVYSAVKNCSLTMEFKDSDRDHLLQMIKNYAEPYSPKLIPHLGNLQGKTFLEFFQSMLLLIKDHYSSKSIKWLGFKEVWTDEFIPVIARDFPQAKIIHILRDPRAVCASKNVSEDKYPWFFLTRQWRKSAALAYHFKNQEFLKNQLLCLQFEELISNPEGTVQKICQFLELPFCDEMIDPGSYLDGSGKPWKQNSSFVKEQVQFDTKAMRRWEKALTRREIQLIEYLCAPEMMLHNYELSESFNPLSEDLILQAPRIEDSSLASWILNIYPNDPLSIATEMAKEMLRYTLLSSKKNEADDVVRGCFLEEKLFNEIKTHSKTLF